MDDKKPGIAIMGLMLAFALVLAYVESLVPIPIGIPGIKLGLPNLAILIVLYLAGYGEGIIIDVLRILLSGFMFGNMFSIAYSLSGGVLSFIVMALLKRIGSFSVMGVSIGGGFAHNMGQLLVAAIVLKSSGLYFYLPVLAIGGVITGALIGVVAVAVLPLIKRTLVN